jgi:proline iminopeptidase
MFLKGAAVTAAAAPIPAMASRLHPATTSTEAEENPNDTLNPPGIRLAGVKMVPVVGGKYKVWTKKIGSGPVKVLILHGGPAVSHEYLEAMESFLPEAGFEIYYYDQLGCGFSDQPDDPSLWTLERYTEEVEEVRRGLGLDHFVLYGQSWGGMLGMEYALKYQQHLRALVISNMTASTKDMMRRTAELKVQMLSPEDLAKLTAMENAGDYDSPEYVAIVKGKLYHQVLCRTKPWPNAVERAHQHMNEKIYVQMWGKSEFIATGNLKDWDRWSRLHEIKVKTLTIGARYDEMDPADMKKMASMVQNGTYAYCPNGSHFALWDDQEIYFKQLLSFLHSVSG